MNVAKTGVDGGGVDFGNQVDIDVVPALEIQWCDLSVLFDYHY
jgi:hypothetical protein